MNFLPKDQIALNFYKKLLVWQQEWHKEYAHANIVSLFMHDIMVYLTNYYLLRHSQDQLTNAKIDFPFLNKIYAQNPFRLDFEEKNISIGNLGKWLNTISHLKKGKSVVLSQETLTFSKRQIVEMSLYYRFSFITENKAYLPDAHTQILGLKKIIQELAQEIQVQNSDIFVDNFLRYAQNFITNKIPKCQDVFIADSRCVLANRINAINYLSQNKQVIALTHGEQANFIADEPAFGYSEYDLCTELIEYGTAPVVCGEYNKPSEIPKIYRRDSERIRNIFQQKNIARQSINKNTKILYVPTCFSANYRYAPFRDFDDEQYLRWQKALFEVFPQLFYKIHPNTIQYGIQVPFPKEQIVYGKLLDILPQYDIIIIDYWSTVTAETFATDKNIFYFDIGLRHLQDSAWTDIEQRAFLTKIDWQKALVPQIGQALEKYQDESKDFINHYTQKYSLATQKTDSIEIIRQIIG